MMKAVFYEGERKLRIDDRERINPGAGEVEIKVAYAGICGTDLHIFHGHMNNRVSTPHVMGHEMSGVVSRVGEGVHQFKPGDRVTVMPLISCGQCPACKDGFSHICHYLKFMGIETPGAFQEYWVVPENTLRRLPDDLDLKYGALIEPLAVACHDIRIGQVRQGDQVVVIGGGPIGTLIALVARSAGAEVVVSEINPHRIRMLQDLGMETCNPKETNLTEYITEKTRGRGADVVFEVTSSTAGAEVMTELPRTRGKIVIVGIFNKAVPVDLHRFFWRELQLFGARVYENEDFDKAIQLATSGELPLDRLITEVYPLNQIKNGFEQMETGGNVMKVLIQLHQA
ncbi:alcohol dehydrogenase catalytic domain-containing protein [Paenibacillus cisolokensis]|uniref:zinc-dependent alcohol dehydrogenase n=1 Tax=Paenibacillus cisolokensis TaxID=1658519 RepID=UPI003D2CF1A2